MATRYIGQATVQVSFTGDPEDNFRVSVSVPGARGRAFLVRAAKSGFGPGVAYDSPQAYDEIAAAAANFAASESPEVQEGISSAYDPSGSTRLHVRRSKGGKGYWA